MSIKEYHKFILKFIIALMLVSAGKIQAQEIYIEGQVIDALTSKPIKGAVVKVAKFSSNKISTTTDYLGTFYLTMPNKYSKIKIFHKDKKYDKYLTLVININDNEPHIAYDISKTGSNIYLKIYYGIDEYEKQTYKELKKADFYVPDIIDYMEKFFPDGKHVKKIQQKHGVDVYIYAIRNENYVYLKKAKKYFKIYAELFDVEKNLEKWANKHLKKITDYLTEDPYYKNKIFQLNQFIDQHPGAYPQIKEAEYDIKLLKILQSDDLEKKYTFLKTSCNGKYRDALIKNIWKKVYDFYQIPKFKEFIKRTPANKYHKMAKDAIYDIEFARIKKKNSIREYERFIKNNPYHPYKTQAEKKLRILLELDYTNFLQAQSLNTIKSYLEYIENNPEGKYIDTAINLLTHAGEKLYPFKKDEKWGFMNKKGEVIIAPGYDMVNATNKYGLARIRNNWKFGYINRNAEIIAQPVYDEVLPLMNGLFVKTYKNKHYGIIKVNGKIVSKPKYDNITEINNTRLIKIEKDQKLGLVNIKGEILSEPHFDEISDFNEVGIARILIDGKYGYINDKGEIIIKPVYNGGVIKPETDLFGIKKDNLWGFINSNEEILIEPQYEWIGDFSAKLGLAKIQLNKKWGLINTDGEIIIQPEYEIIHLFNETDLIHIKKNNKWGLINTDGKIVVQPQYENINFFIETDLIPVKKNNKWGFINTKGKMIVPPQFDLVKNFVKNIGLARFQINEKWGYINTQGKIVIEPVFEIAKPFTEHKLAIVKKDGKYGVIDTQGKFIVKPKYTWIRILDDKINHKPIINVLGIKKEDIIGTYSTGNLRFDDISEFNKNGIARIKKNGKFGYINTSGKIIIQPVYDRAIDADSYPILWTENGVTSVGIEDKSIDINKAKLIWDFGEYYITKVEKYGKFGIIDSSGKTILPLKYDDIMIYDEHHFGIPFGSRWGIIDEQGNYIGFTQADVDEENRKIREAELAKAKAEAEEKRRIAERKKAERREAARRRAAERKYAARSSQTQKHNVSYKKKANLYFEVYDNSVCIKNSKLTVKNINYNGCFIDVNNYNHSAYIGGCSSKGVKGKYKFNWTFINDCGISKVTASDVKSYSGTFELDGLSTDYRIMLHIGYSSWIEVKGF